MKCQRYAISNRSTWLRAIALLCIFMAFALVITWPLVLNLSRHIPLGSEIAQTVPYFNLWTLWWNFDRLTHGYSGYWNAPIFAPINGAFAFSEPQFLTGILGAPIWLATGNSVLAYNLIVLLFLTFNGAATYVLMRGNSSDPFPSVLTGLIMEALPFTTQEVGVLQLIPVFGILLTLHFTYRFSESRAVRSAVFMSLAFALTFLITGQYGLLTSLMFLLLSPFFLRRGMFQWRPIAALLLGLAVAFVLVAPIAILQVSIVEGYDLTRALTTVTRNSAEWADYIHLPSSTLGYRLWNSNLVPESSQRLYPGTGILVLGLWGMLTGLRDQKWRRWTLLCLIGSTLAFVLSFGPTLEIGVLKPYRFLREYYPGIAHLRSPFRFGVFVHIFLALLAGLGLAAIYRNWHWHGRTLVVIGLTIITLAEIFPAPIRLTEGPIRPAAAWATWLDSQPEGTIVAHIPFPKSGRTTDLEQTATWMILQMWHGQPMVNGYSGFFPASYRLLARKMENFPDYDSLDALEQRNVSYILIDREWMDSRSRRTLESLRDCLMPIHYSSTLIVFELTDVVDCS